MHGVPRLGALAALAFLTPCGDGRPEGWNRSDAAAWRAGLEARLDVDGFLQWREAAVRTTFGTSP